MADSSSGDPAANRSPANPSATGAPVHSGHYHNHHSHSHSNHHSSNRPHLHLSASSLMRAYLDSLPDRVSARRELSSYQFWKAARTELAAAFLFFLFTVSSCFSRLELMTGANYSQYYSVSAAASSSNFSTSSAFALLELKSAATVGLSVATLVQCFGHVSGCHLSIAITLGLVVSGRVSTARLVVYLLAQLIGSLAGGALVYALFGAVPPMAAPAEGLAISSSLSAAQVFGFEFLATFLVVLAYLANADASRMDLGFKALSIGLAYSVAHLFAFSSTGASFSPARALAASLFSGNWCLHWVYWVSPLVGGLFGGVTYEYVGSIKPLAEPSSLMAGGVLNSTELKHPYNSAATPSRNSTHSAVTSPMSNYPPPTTTIVTIPVQMPHAPEILLNPAAAAEVAAVPANSSTQPAAPSSPSPEAPQHQTNTTANSAVSAASVDCSNSVITSAPVVVAAAAAASATATVTSSSNAPSAASAASAVSSNLATYASNGGIAIAATGSGRW